MSGVPVSARVQALTADVLLASAGAALLARQTMNALHVPGIDFVHVWNAAHQFAQTGGAYADPLFTYPPGSALALAPVGLLGYGAAKLLMVLINVSTVLAAAWLTVDLLQRRPTRRAIAIGLLALGVADAVASTWANGNVNGPLVLLEVLALRAVCRGSWMRGATLLGLSLMVKPVLLPLLVVFAVRRRWRPLIVAILVPLAGTVAGCLVVHDSSRFFSVVVPFLAHGAQLSFNDSLVGIGNLVGLPAAAVWSTRVGLGAAIVMVLLRLCWQRDTGPLRQRVCYEAGFLLSAWFLLAPMSETYYSIYLMPAIASWAISSRRQAWAATVLVAACFATFRLPGNAGPVTVSTPLAIRPTLGWLICLIVFGHRAASSDAGSAEAGSVEDHHRLPAYAGGGVRVPGPPYATNVGRPAARHVTDAALAPGGAAL